MGKKKKAPEPPSFQPSYIYDGDRLVSSTYLDPNTGGIATRYYRDPAEEERRRMVQQEMNNIIPTLGIAAPEQVNSWDNMKDDYITQATTDFNRQYDPALRGLREDVTSRFGTTRATPYFEQLESLEKNVRTPALNEIIRNGSLLRTDLYNQEEANKLRRLQALGGTLDQTQGSFLNGIQAPLQSGSLLNQFNQNSYMQKLQQFQNDLARRQNTTNAILGIAGKFF